MTAIESMENGVLILDVSGQLNAVTSLELHSILEERMPEVEKLIFEFKDLDYISSGGLRELLYAYEAMNPKGGMLIRHANPGVREVLDVTGFSTIFEIEEE